MMLLHVIDSDLSRLIGEIFICACAVALAALALFLLSQCRALQRELERVREQLAAERAGAAARQAADKPRPANFTDAWYPWEHRA